VPHIDANGLRLEYECLGDPKGPAILLVAGLGVQMINWPDHFVTPLVQHGYHVIRYDNRDIGLSTTFDHQPTDVAAVLDAVANGDTPDVAYTLPDMAADGIAILDALCIDQAHIIGVSMGGMIAQAIAIDFPDRVASLTSMMSATGEPEVGQPTDEALAAVMSGPSSTERSEMIANGVQNAKIWGSPDHFDPQHMESLFNAGWDRVGGPQSANVARHLSAIIASPSRVQALRQLDVPTLVVHGTADTLITPPGGERTAALIPGAKLLTVEGMGHDLPEALVPQISKAIIELVDSVEHA